FHVTGVQTCALPIWITVPVHLGLHGLHRPRPVHPAVHAPARDDQQHLHPDGRMRLPCCVGPHIRVSGKPHPVRAAGACKLPRRNRGDDYRVTESTITLAMVALLLMMTVVLCMTIHVMRDALREHRLTKEAERLIEEERRVHHLMLIAGGSAGVNFAAQQLAVAMLSDYPRAANS